MLFIAAPRLLQPLGFFFLILTAADFSRTSASRLLLAAAEIEWEIVRIVRQTTISFRTLLPRSHRSSLTRRRRRGRSKSTGDWPQVPLLCRQKTLHLSQTGHQRLLGRRVTSAQSEAGNSSQEWRSRQDRAVKICPGATPRVRTRTTSKYRIPIKIQKTRRLSKGLAKAMPVTQRLSCTLRLSVCLPMTLTICFPLQLQRRHRMVTTERRSPLRTATTSRKRKPLLPPIPATVHPSLGHRRRRVLVPGLAAVLRNHLWQWGQRLERAGAWEAMRRARKKFQEERRQSFRQLNRMMKLLHRETSQLKGSVILLVGFQLLKQFLYFFILLISMIFCFIWNNHFSFFNALSTLFPSDLR